MAYNNYAASSVAVSKSQEKIRRLILDHDGKGIAFISQPPTEGFEAHILIDGKYYHIRISVVCLKKDNPKKQEQEERRVWRVLYHHMKDVYVASESGVFEFRVLMMPFVVTQSGRTIAEHIMPNLDKAISGNSVKLLTGGL
jgi:hypothetical protein